MRNFGPILGDLKKPHIKNIIYVFSDLFAHYTVLQTQVLICTRQRGQKTPFHPAARRFEGMATSSFQYHTEH